MSLTISRDHPSAKDDFTEEHGIVPGLMSQVFPLIALLLVVLGDLASFWITLQRSFPGMAPWMGWMLTLAMTAAAVLLMVEAGMAEAERRNRNEGRIGKSPVRWRVFAWLVLGVTAFLLRMAAPPEETGTGGFGQDSGFGSGFGTGPPTGFGEAAAESTDVYLGPLTLHTDNLTAALTLLAIYIAGGVGAFWYGKKAHNPRLTEVRRASRKAWAAKRPLRRAQKARDDAASDLDRLSDAAEQFERARLGLLDLDRLEHELALSEAASALMRDLTQRISEKSAELSETRAEMAANPERLRLLQQEAEHAGEEAKQAARVEFSSARTASDQFERARLGLLDLDRLEHELALSEAASALMRDLTQRISEKSAELSETRAEMAANPERLRLLQQEAEHAGEEAKQAARVQIASYRGEPGATSGLTNGNDESNGDDE